MSVGLPQRVFPGGDWSGIKAEQQLFLERMSQVQPSLSNYRKSMDRLNFTEKPSKKSMNNDFGDELTKSKINSFEPFSLSLMPGGMEKSSSIQELDIDRKKFSSLVENCNQLSSVNSKHYCLSVKRTIENKIERSTVASNFNSLVNNKTAFNTSLQSQKIRNQHSLSSVSFGDTSNVLRNSNTVTNNSVSFHRLQTTQSNSIFSDNSAIDNVYSAHKIQGMSDRLLHDSSKYQMQSPQKNISQFNSTNILNKSYLSEMNPRLKANGHLRIVPGTSRSQVRTSRNCSVACTTIVSDPSCENGIKTTAKKAELNQHAEMSTDSFGKTNVREQVNIIGSEQEALLSRTSDGVFVPTNVTGRNVSTRADVGYVHEGDQRHSFIYDNYTSGIAPLIKPPPGKIKGKCKLETSETSFVYLLGQPIRHETKTNVIEGKISASESDNESDDDLYILNHKNGINQRSSKSNLLRALGYSKQKRRSHSKDQEGQLAIKLPKSSSVHSTSTPNSLVSRVVEEMLSTESTYVYVLARIMRFRNAVENTCLESSRKLSDQNFARVFLNIDQIFRLHNDHFLPALQKRFANWDISSCLGDLFRDLVPSLVIYAEYMDKYMQSSRVLQALLIKSDLFRQLVTDVFNLDEDTQDHHSQGHVIQSHMIVPVQRLPRYGLLLREYLKHLPTDSTDQSVCRDALKHLTTLTSQCDKQISKQSEMKDLLDLQNSITRLHDLVFPGRFLIKQGPVMKISTRSEEHQARHLFLLTDLLLLCANRTRQPSSSRQAHHSSAGDDTRAASYRLTARFSLYRLHIFDGDNIEVENSFYVSNGQDKPVEIYTSSRQQKFEWLRALNDAVHELHESSRYLMNNPRLSAQRSSAKNMRNSRSSMSGSSQAPHQVSRCMICAVPFTLLKRRQMCSKCFMITCCKCTVKIKPECRKQLKSESTRFCTVCAEDAYSVGAGAYLTTSSASVTNVAPATISSSMNCPVGYSLADISMYSEQDCRRSSSQKCDDSFQHLNNSLSMAPDEDSILSEWLELRVHKQWVMRYFCLRANRLLYLYRTQAASSSDDEHSNKLGDPCKTNKHVQIPQDHSQLVTSAICNLRTSGGLYNGSSVTASVCSSSEGRHVFSLVTQRHRHLLRAIHDTQMRRWIKAINIASNV